ncbi:MAG: translation initiation factor IF-2 N-terminal domain-containing protein [Bacteroidota bacterium]
MRISQLARKHDLSVQEIISFLQALDKPLKSIYPNARLDESTIAQLMDHFGLVTETIANKRVVEVSQQSNKTDLKEKTASKKAIFMASINENPFKNEQIEPEKIESRSIEEQPELPDIPNENTEIKGEAIIEDKIDLKRLTAAPTEIDMEKRSECNKTEVPKDEEIIQSDQLIKMLESEEQPTDIKKIKLIKAPKKKLNGLKVLDKIDIPEDPRKKGKEQEQKPPPLKLSPEERAERVKKREEYKEKRRLESKKKQEAYEARKEQRRKEQEATRLKAIKEAHYRQKLNQANTQKSKLKSRKGSPQMGQIAGKQLPQTKTLLGKFWRWLNT